MASRRLGKWRTAVHTVENTAFQTQSAVRNKLGIAVAFHALAGSVYFEKERAFYATLIT